MIRKFSNKMFILSVAFFYPFTVTTTFAQTKSEPDTRSIQLKQIELLTEAQQAINELAASSAIPTGSRVNFGRICARFGARRNVDSQPGLSMFVSDRFPYLVLDKGLSKLMKLSPNGAYTVAERMADTQLVERILESIRPDSHPGEFKVSEKVNPLRMTQYFETVLSMEHPPHIRESNQPFEVFGRLPDRARAVELGSDGFEFQHFRATFSRDGSAMLLEVGMLIDSVQSRPNRFVEARIFACSEHPGLIKNVEVYRSIL